MKKLILFTALALIAFANSTYSQLSINDIDDPQQLAEVLAGYNINVSNASLLGDDLQSGAFTFNGSGLGVSSGVILSSGNIFDAVGPNSSSNTSTDFWGAGHPLLSALSGHQTHDAAVLQFDFEVQSDNIEFNFIFMSEEYNEYVGSSFNDVFAFFISGPGIEGEENLAVVPGTTVPVSINTINNGSFWQFYNDNENGATNIEFDGFTTLMKAEKSGLQKCGVYTLKLMVADASDGIFDAGVLLQENSLIQANVSATASTYSDNNTALEGCIEANFIFELDEAMDYDTYIPIQVGGTATNGVDYSYIDSIIVIPEGETSASIILKALTDGIPEGQETVEIYYMPEPCTEYDTAYLYIDDYQPLEYTSHPSDAQCNGSNSGEVYFEVTGGIPEYRYFLTDSLTGDTATYYTNPVTGLESGTYYVEIIDGYGCDAEDNVFGGVFNTGPTFLPDGTGVSYTTSITVDGFGANEILETIDQISVCASLEHSYCNDLTIFLQAPNGSQVMLKNVGGTGGAYNACNMGEPVASGPIDEWNSSNITPGIGYEYCWNSDPTYGTMNDMINSQNLPYYTYISTYGNELSDYYLPAGSYTPVGSFESLLGSQLNGDWTIIVTDNYPLDNGYIFEWNLSITADMPDSVFTIQEPLLTEVTSTKTNPDCGLNNGAIDLTVTGEAAPYTFLWSTGDTTEDIQDLPSGTYSVQVTGSDTCTYDYSFSLPSSGGLLLEAETQAVSCIGLNDGAIDLTVNGGTEPFIYAWNNGEASEDIENLGPANYTVTVTDDNGCSGIETFTVNNAMPIQITAELIHEQCGDNEGAINISVTGGQGTYIYAWSNGAATEDVDELSQGAYTITVTDENSCTKIATYTIINYVGNCIPECDLEITNETVSNEHCGNEDGEIDLTIFTSNFPYTINWSSGQNTATISDLVSGNYTVTITDAEGCLVQKTYNIANETGNLQIADLTTENESCGDGSGSVNITINGGALPYSYEWSNGSTSEDLSNLHAGNYSVTITDANYCSTTGNATVENETNGLELVWYNVVDETCGNNNGSIDIMIQGATYFTAYQWSNGAYTQDLTNIGEGTYTCTITDYYGCSIVTPEFTVNNQSGGLEIDYIDIDHEVCGNNQGEIEIEVVGGNTPYSYLWSNEETSQNIYNLNKGTYSCEVTDANGCTVNTGDLIVLNESGTLHLESVVKTNEVCSNNQGAIDLTITGGSTPYNFAWNNGSTSEDLNNIAAGNYSCDIIDANGCEISVNASIINSQGTLEIVNTIVTDESCGNENGAIDLFVNGGTAPLEYQWNSGQQTEDISNISAGLYICSVTDAQGCEATTSANVNNNSGTLSVDNYYITNEQCGQNDGSIDQVVSGTGTPIVYQWSNGETTEDISNLPVGIYTCTITDSYDCQLIAGPYAINNSSPSLKVTNKAIVDESCGNEAGSIDLTISGGTLPLAFQWSNGETTEDISNLSAGIYSYTITDAADCSIYGNAEVENNSGTLNLNSYSITNEVCSNGLGAIDIASSGGEMPHTYEWSNGETTEDINNISAGEYFVTITDNTGCQITSPSLIVINDPGTFKVVNIAVTDEQCSDSSGAIDVTLSGGMMPVIYSWNTGEYTKDLDELTQGIYSCTTTDNNGCILNYSATVKNIPSDLNVDDVEITDATCGEANGMVDISVSGGTPPYTFNWSNGLNTEDIENLYGGNFTCVISDAEGCTVYANAQVNDLGGDLNVQLIELVDEICNNSQGFINISVSGGITPYSYQWSHGPTTQDAANIQEGDYSVTITDGLGCTDIITATVHSVFSDLQIDNEEISNETCDFSNGSINLTVSGSATPIAYSWSNGSSSQDLSNLSSGTYSVTITDAHGCQLFNEYIIENVTNGFELANVNAVNEYCLGGDGSIDLTINGGITPYNFTWSNGETTEDISNLSAGFYSCTITDDLGCELFYETELINATNGLAMDLDNILNDHCNGSVGGVNIEVTDGVEPYSFLWSNGSEDEDLSNVAEGIYSVAITDSEGCMVASESYEIINLNNDNMGISSMYVANDFCNLGTGHIAFVPQGNTGYYTYRLNGIPNSSSEPLFENLYAGIYTVTIADFECRFDTVVTVLNSASFDAYVSEITDDYCWSGQGTIDITVEPSLNYTYLWSNGAITEDLTDITPGIYTCTITKEGGCQKIISAEVGNEASFTVSYESTEETCGNGEGAIDLSTSGLSFGSYLWNNGETTQDIEGLSAGIYTCTVTDQYGCSEEVEVEIFNNTGDMQVSPVVYNDYCSQALGSIELNISGVENYSVQWSSGETSEIIDGLASGNYSVTVTNTDNDCIYSNSFVVGNNGSFNVNAIIKDASGEFVSDGSIDLIMYPTANYSFSWSTGAASEDLNNILPGEYAVEVTGSDGCIIARDYIVDYTIEVVDASKVNSSFSAYPNPTKGTIYIKYNLEANKEVKINVLSSMGEEVGEFEFTGSVGEFILDMGLYAPGVYIIKLSTDSETQMIKVIKRNI